MGLRRDAAGVIFNLPGYRVVDAVDLPLGGRRVKGQTVDLADGCPVCGVHTVSMRTEATFHRLTAKARRSQTQLADQRGLWPTTNAVADVQRLPTKPRCARKI